MGIPTLWEGFLDFLLISYPFDQPQLVPTSWAVANELIFYALIGLGISKTLLRTWIWFICSLVYWLLVSTYGLDNFYLYFSPLAGSLPFALGALIYFYKDRFREPGTLLLIGTAVLLMVFTGQFSGILSRLITMLGAAMLVVALYNMRSDDLAPVDRFIGGLSYHIYLNHFLAGSLFLLAFPDFRIERYYHLPRTPEIALYVTLISVLLAVVAHVIIDWNVDKLRFSVRERSETRSRALEPGRR